MSILLDIMNGNMICINFYLVRKIIDLLWLRSRPLSLLELCGCHGAHANRWAPLPQFFPVGLLLSINRRSTFHYYVIYRITLIYYQVLYDEMGSSHFFFFNNLVWLIWTERITNLNQFLAINFLLRLIFIFFFWYYFIIEVIMRRPLVYLIVLRLFL